MRSYKIFFFLASAIIFVSCSETFDSTQIVTPGPGTEDPVSDWLIPEDFVFDSGAGRDGIPALNYPEYVFASEVDFLDDDDLVLALRIGGEIRIFPHRILDWHEVVNDKIQGIPVTITYCPLTDSGIAWRRTIDKEDLRFGVSGLLYNNNLILFDRETDSFWSQMMFSAVHGELKSKVAAILPLIEGTWKTFRRAYPNAQVLSTNTGYDRPYHTSPYGLYKKHPTLIFYPITNDDPRIGRKERVHGIIGVTETRVFQFNEYPDTLYAKNIIMDGFHIVTVGNRSMQLLASYRKIVMDSEDLTFKPVQNELPAVLIDSEGTRWDIFGYAIDGPRTGERLLPANFINSFWFAWSAFFPDAKIEQIVDDSDEQDS
jgi:hypothetical protein